MASSWRRLPSMLCCRDRGRFLVRRSALVISLIFLAAQPAHAAPIAVESFDYKPDAPLQVTGKTKRRGTKVTFKPDGQIFETLEFSFDVLAQRLRELAFLNKGLEIALKDERKEKEQVFKYKGGIVSFVEHLNGAKTPLHKPIFVEIEKNNVMLEVAIQYNDGYAENMYSFANNINTHEGGTHLSGFRAALSLASRSARSSCS